MLQVTYFLTLHTSILNKNRSLFTKDELIFLEPLLGRMQEFGLAGVQGGQQFS